MGYVKTAKRNRVTLEEAARDILWHGAGTVEQVEAEQRREQARLERVARDKRLLPRVHFLERPLPSWWHEVTGPDYAPGARALPDKPRKVNARVLTTAD